MKKFNYSISVSAVFLFIIMLSINMGCNKESGITDSNSQDTHFNNFSVGFFSENNTKDYPFIITEAKFVVRQMMLKVYNEETSYNIRTEPFVVNLDVHARMIIAAIANLPLGNYERLKLQLHKPSPQENISDPDFFESNRSFSVVVKGYYNNVPFVYKSGMTAARGMDIENSPLFISLGGSVNITVRLNPYSWFDHNGLLDPMNENNRHYIDENIRESFKRVFRDIDMNGQPD